MKLYQRESGSAVTRKYCQTPPRPLIQMGERSNLGSLRVNKCKFNARIGVYGPTVIEIEPVAPVAVPVMVVVPSAPPTVPTPPPATVMTDGLLLTKLVSAVTSWPFRVAVNSTAVPAGSMARLSSLPRE